MTDEHKRGIRGVGTVTDFGVKGFQALGGRNQTYVGQSGTRIVTVGWGTGTLGIFVTIVKVRVARGTGTGTGTVTVMIAVITVTTAAVTTVEVNTVAAAGKFITTGGGAIGAVSIGVVMAVGAVVIRVVGVADVVGHEWSAVVAMCRGAFGLLARVEGRGAVTVTMFWGVDLHFFYFCFCCGAIVCWRRRCETGGMGKVWMDEKRWAGNGGRAVGTFVVGFGTANVCGWSAFAGEAPVVRPLPGRVGGASHREAISLARWN